MQLPSCDANYLPAGGPAETRTVSTGLDDRRLQDALRTATRFSHLVHVQECASTQDAAAQDPLPGNCVHWADHQTRGRGRSNHVWQDEPGLDLAVTFRLRGFTPARPLALPIAVPLAVAQTVEPHVAAPVRIKWPNDVLVGGRKICGILIDGQGGPDATWLLGVGLNVNRVRFPPELEQGATSIALEGGHELDRHELLLTLASNLERAVELAGGLRAGELLPPYRGMLRLMGRTVEVRTHSGMSRGRLLDVDFEDLTLDDGRSVPLGAVVALREALSE